MADAMRVTRSEREVAAPGRDGELSPMLDCIGGGSPSRSVRAGRRPVRGPLHGAGAAQTRQTALRTREIGASAISKRGR